MMLFMAAGREVKSAMFRVITTMSPGCLTARIEVRRKVVALPVERCEETRYLPRDGQRPIAALKPEQEYHG